MDLLNQLYSNFINSKTLIVYLIHVLLAHHVVLWAEKDKLLDTHLSIEQQLQKARDYFYDKEYQLALDVYSVVFDEHQGLDDRELDEIQFNIGRCYAELGKDNQALQNFSKVIGRDPTSSYATQSVYQIGNLFVSRYQYDLAGGACQKIAERHPQTRSGAIASYLAGQYWHYANQDKKAVQAYQKFLVDYPESPYRSSGLQSLVQIWIQTKEFESAEKLLKNLLASPKLSVPNHTELSELIADLYKAQGRSDLALKFYESALDKSPTDTNLLKKMGEMYAEIGDQQKALGLWSRIVSSNPDQYYRYQQMADIYVSNQLYDQAISAYQSALKLNPTSSYLYAELAGIYKIKGQIDQMVDVLLQALSMVNYSFNNRDIILQELDNIYEGNRQHQLLREVIAKLELNAVRSAKQILTMAELHFYAKNFDQSLIFFQMFSQQYPADKGELLKKYAQILDRNESISADQFYQALIDFYPDSLIKRQSQLRLANRYQESNEWELSLAVLQRIENKDTPVQLKIAELLLHDAYRFLEAERLYKKLSRKHLPIRYQTQVNLGLAETLLLSDRPVAARSILQPISDNKNSIYQARAIKLIADSYLFEYNFEQARENYQRVAQLLTDYTNLALAWLIRINTYSSSNQKFLIIYIEGEYLKRQGQIEKAVGHLQLAIQKHPQSLIFDDLLWMLGDLYLYQRKYKNAIQTYRQIIESESGLSIEAQARVADIYQFDLNNNRNAFELYTQLADKYSDSVVSAYAQQQADMLRLQLKPNKLEKPGGFK